MQINIKKYLDDLNEFEKDSENQSEPEFDIKNIKNPAEVRNLLSDLVEEERSRKRISGREFMMAEDDDMDGMN